MDEYQDRVVAEKRDLDEKLTRLRAFYHTGVFVGLDKIEQILLIHQEAFMQAYSDTLAKRISLW